MTPTVRADTVNALQMLTRYLDPESRNGQRLLCRSEFHGQVEYRTSCLIARRGKEPGSNERQEIPQAKLIHGQYMRVKPGPRL